MYPNCMLFIMRKCLLREKGELQQTKTLFCPEQIEHFMNKEWTAASTMRIKAKCKWPSSWMRGIGTFLLFPYNIDLSRD